MSAIIAIMLVSLLFLLAIAIVIIARKQEYLARYLALAGIILFVFLGAYYTGGIRTPDPELLARTAAGDGGNMPDARCTELVDLLVKNRVVLSQSVSGRVEVDARYWSQIAQPVRNIAVACLAKASKLEPDDIQIFER